MRPDLRARVLEAASREPSPTRARTRSLNGLAALLGGGLALATFLSLGGVGPLPRSFLELSALGWGLVAIALTGLALLRGRTMLGMPTRWTVAFAIGGVPIVGAWVVALLLSLDVHSKDAPFKANLVCLILAFVFALGPLAALVYARRGTDPVHPRATAALVGAAAGSWGGLLMHLHCPYSDPIHALLGHVLPIAALACIASFALPRVLGPPRH